MNDVKSNLLTDESLAKEFNKELVNVANALMRNKFYSLFEVMYPEDIVNNIWLKVVKYNISFDESYKCKLSSFAYTLVTQECTDALRYYSSKKRTFDGVVMSMEDSLKCLGDDYESIKLKDKIEDESSEMAFEEIISNDSINTLCEDFSSCRFDMPGLIDDMIVKGLSLNGIAEAREDVQYNSLRKFMKAMGKVLNRRYKGDAQPLSDLMYNSDIEYTSDIFESLNYIITDEGVKLSDMVRMVMKGSSYKEIGKRFGMDISDVENVLGRYESLMI